MTRIHDTLPCNSEAFESLPLIHPSGFREYDARFRYPEQVNLLGFQVIGAALATQLRRQGENPPRLVVGHDYRSYSMAIKQALMVGLLSGGAEIYDIGLALTPMANFARMRLQVPGMAMVTASHNENGWCGVKIGSRFPLTHGPDEMKELKEIVFAGRYDQAPGRYVAVPSLRQQYLDDLIHQGPPLPRRLRAVVGAGNGTAAIFAAPVLSAIGLEIIPAHLDPDWTFPNYTPNPEDLKMLHHLRKEVIHHQADLALAFDGDGDRLGVVDELGNELYSDKLGLLLARRLAPSHPEARFIVDVKSTGLFMDDPVLHAAGASVEYWITGHSYMKRRLLEQKALAAFEKSGHFFFAPPLGYGYDDALSSALLVLRLLAADKRTLSEWSRDLRPTWQSPTMAPHCPEDQKYPLVERAREHYQAIFRAGGSVCGQSIRELILVNGVRVVLADGTWGLVRASSNKPTLVVVVESPVGPASMRAMFHEIDQLIRTLGPVGEYDQTLPADPASVAGA